MDDTRPDQPDATGEQDPPTTDVPAGHDGEQDSPEPEHVDPPEGPVVEETPEDPDALVGAPVASDVDLDDLGVLSHDGEDEAEQQRQDGEDA